MLEAVEKKDYIRQKAALLTKAVWNSTFRKVSKCACAVCAVSKIVVCSKVVDPEGNPLWQGEMTVSNDAGSRYYKEKRGNFRILVKSGTKQIVLIIKAKFQVFELHEGQPVFCTIVLQKKSPVIKFPANKKKASLLKDPGETKLCRSGHSCKYLPYSWWKIIYWWDHCKHRGGWS